MYGLYYWICDCRSCLVFVPEVCLSRSDLEWVLCTEKIDEVNCD